MESKGRFTGVMNGKLLTAWRTPWDANDEWPSCRLPFPNTSSADAASPETVLTQCCSSQSHQFSVTRAAPLTSKPTVPLRDLGVPSLSLDSLSLIWPQQVVGSANSKLFGPFAKLIFRWSLTSIKPPAKLQEASTVMCLLQHNRVFSK